MLDTVRTSTSHCGRRAAYNLITKLQTGLLIAAILSHSAYGKSGALLSITSVEHRRGNSDKPYRVAAKTLEPGPKFYYILICENRAVHLEVGHRYRAEARGTKTLLLFLNEASPTMSGIEGIECAVESEDATASRHGK